MTPHYARKLSQALLDIKLKIEKDTTPPGITDIEILFDSFLTAVDSGDMSKQKKAIDDLLSGLVRWEVDNL